MFNSVQGGFIGNAGAPDTTVAGTWTRDPFPQGQQPEVKQLWRRGVDNTPTGQRIKNLRDVMESNPGAVFAPQAMGIPGMNIGNIGGMSAALNPSSRYLQSTPSRTEGNKRNNERQAPEEIQEPEETQAPFMSGTLNPFSGYMQAMMNMQNSAKEAGFDRKTVS
jgi:hypothetical protein